MNQTSSTVMPPRLRLVAVRTNGLRRGAVVAFGAVPAGLAAAIRLKQVKPELSVVVLEKGAEVGAHILSGAVVDPIGIDRLLPGWRDGALR